MSNISKKIIKIEPGVDVSIDAETIKVHGPKGDLDAQIPSGITVIIGDGNIRIKKDVESAEIEKFAGLIRALVANMVQGVSGGFQKKLELSGVGYRASVSADALVLNVGFAVPVKIQSKPGVAISVEENIITVSGANKQLVGDVAADIRRVRPPDPYKAKGIKYLGEHIRRKVGKAAKAVGAATK